MKDKFNSAKAKFETQSRSSGRRRHYGD